MTQEKQIALLEQFHKDKMETLISKGKDYASKDDILSNFKNSGAIVGVSKERQILSLIATKVARLGNLLDNKDKPNNESIEDTVKDLSGYVDLMYCTLKENQKDIIIDLMNDSLYSPISKSLKTEEVFRKEHPKFTGILSQLKEDESQFKVGDSFLLDGEYHYISRVTSTDGFTSINFRNPRDTDCIIYFSPEEIFIEMILNNRIQMLNCTDRIIKITTKQK